MNRRYFLKFCGLAASSLTLGIGSNGCTPYSKNVNWKEVPDSEFSLQKFDEWFAAHKLYNERNKNLTLFSISQHSTFTSQVFAGYSPGIGYQTSKFYAAAEGYVSKCYTINTAFTGRLGGDGIEVSHPGNFEVNDYKAFAFTTSYAHIGKRYVQTGDRVARGQLLADLEYPANAKFMMTRGFNWIDPDNFGPNHGRMNYWDEKTNLESNNPYDKKLKQREIIIKLSDSIDPKLYINHDVMLSKEHRPVKEGKFCRWDDVEIMRYLDELYKARPQAFQGLSAELFAEYRSEFYANQPIVLTLPLKA